MSTIDERVQAAQKGTIVETEQVKISIPATIEEAVKQLGGLGRLLTAKEWERAAIVYAFTYEPGHLSEQTGSEVNKFTAESFATLDIHGLRSKVTVYAHRHNWTWAIQEGIASEVEPGQFDVVLPTVDYPPTGRPRGILDNFKPDASPEVTVAGIRQVMESRPEVFEAVKRDFVERVKEDPELAAETHRAAMAQPEVAKRIENEFVQRAAQDSMLASRVNSAWTEFHPTPTPKHEPVSGRDYMVYTSFGASARAGYEQDRKTALPLLLRFIAERRPLSDEIVKDFDAIITHLERLRALIESDEDAIRKAIRPEADISVERLLNSVGL